MESTVYPGCSNTIFCKAQETAKIIYLGQGQHSLQIGSDKIRILSGKNCIRFYQNNSLLAIMYSLSDTANTSDAWEQRQTVYILQKIPCDYLLLILSFPLLQIGI
ncbi:MAG: hypothetical protein IJN20_03860 [Oscillospiraceae bacterium]|nr:hypothetical protein [Oscillospiraceae bacterium]